MGTMPDFEKLIVFIQDFQVEPHLNGIKENHLGGQFHVFIALEGIRSSPGIVMEGLSLFATKIF